MQRYLCQQSMLDQGMTSQGSLFDTHCAVTNTTSSCCLLPCSAASHLGLPEGLLVAQGGSDAFIGMVGLGVVRAGQMAMLTGAGHRGVRCEA
jgi:ribulose kinase